MCQPTIASTRDVRGGPMQRDLADIGGETGAATHGTSITGQGRRTKPLDTAQRPCNRTAEQMRNTMPGNPRELITGAERRFPVRIRIAVPPEGLGRQHARMTAWLDENCGADGGR